MESADLQKIAERNRSMREAGTTLLFASGLLALFLFVPSAQGVPKDQDARTDEHSAAAATPDAFARVPLEAAAAIVYDLSTGETLYAKNADAQLPLASLTKLLTVYAALETLSPETRIAISADAASAEAPRAFSAGQTFALDDLSRLTLVASLNDGATAIAETVATRENRSQAAMLAGAAAALDLSQTYALNGSGLDMNEAISGGYGSARDLARLAGALLKRAPDIAHATTQASAEATSGGVTIRVKNTDPMTDTIPRLLLSKTGYTDLAGGNLALVFDSGIGHPVAVVVLGSSKKSRFTDGTALVAATFAHFAGIASL